jgi:hypothetical protein
MIGFGRTMEVYYHFLDTTTTKPMCLCTARKRYTLWRKSMVFGELEIKRRGRPVHVPILSKAEAPQLGTQHGKHDILKVGI